MNNNLMEIIDKTRSEVQAICHEYGIYGNVAEYNSYTNNTSDRKIYIIAGPDPRIQSNLNDLNIDYEEIIRRNNRTEGLFYPNLWVWDINDGNKAQSYDELTDYAYRVMFLKQVYSAFNTPLPEKIRDNEINGLYSHYQAYVNGEDGEKETFLIGKKALESFFKDENSTNRLRKEWMDFYRSDKFPQENQSLLKKIQRFLNRGSNIIDLDLLHERCNDIQTLEMEEYEYKVFAEKMNQLYPYVTYAISDVDVIDHGSVGKTDPTTDPPTKYVTQEEFAVTMKNRFAKEGWNCIKNLNPCYWEKRKIHYKEIDEPIIASVYNSVVYNYTNSLDKSSIDYDGDISLHRIPITNFMNFVSLSKAYNLRYYIDFSGQYSESSLDFINVITRKSSDSLINEIMDGMLKFKIESQQKLAMVIPSLNKQIEDISNTKDINRKIDSKRELANVKEDQILF